MHQDDFLDPLKKVQKMDAPLFLRTRIHARLQAQEADRLPRTWAFGGALAIGLLLWLHIFLPGLSQPAPENNNIAAQYGLYQSQQLYGHEN
jgi:hypothetical protein